MAHRRPVGLAAHDDGDGVPRHDAAPLAASKKCGNSQAFTLKQGCRSRLQRFAVSQPSLAIAPNQSRRPCRSRARRRRRPFRAQRALRTEVERLAAELTDMRAHAASLEALAQEDPLTGLLNRRGFFRDLARAIAYRARYGTRSACCSRISTASRHQRPATGTRSATGPSSMSRRSSANNVRASDSVGRLGGDEFAVILWQVDEASARQKAASLEAMIGGPRSSTAALTLPLERPRSASTPSASRKTRAEEALARADRAMYSPQGGSVKGPAASGDDVGGQLVFELA